MILTNRFLRSVVLVVVLAGLCGAQSSNKPKAIDRAALGKHRNAITKSIKEATKETVEGAQSRLDDAAIAFHEWMTEENVKPDDKLLAPIIGSIERKQDELNELRGSPPKRPEFEPFIGKWTSEHGSLSMNEFGMGQFLWHSKNKSDGVLGISFSKPITVAKDGKSFKSDTTLFSFGDDPEALEVEIMPSGGRKVVNYESKFTMKRVSKTPDPAEMKTKPSRKK